METKIKFKTVKYKILKGGSEKISIYFKTDSGESGFAPLDPANRHYIAIQEWVADGNTIEEAD
tara:strand:+ start:275 stop:463 length:189 start_codon:yes stop_codon:yes gene_type:complete